MQHADRNIVEESPRQLRKYCGTREGNRRDSAGGARTDRLQTVWLEQFSEEFRRQRVLLEEMGTRFDSLGEEVMPPNTNRRPAVAGGWVLLGGRRPVEVNCRDEVARRSPSYGIAPVNTYHRT